MLGTEQTGDLLLALDTSGDVCSVALLRGGQLVSEHTFLHRMHLSERLLDHFSAVLGDANASLDDVAAFGIGIGPGSFTGTRIGVMTLKTLAAVQRRPIYAVDSLLAVAGSYRGVERSLVVPMLPCRTGVVFAALFRFGSGTQMPWIGIEPAALSLPELCERIRLCIQNLSDSLFDDLSNDLSEVLPDGLSNDLSSRGWTPEVILCGAANERYGDEMRDRLCDYLLPDGLYRAAGLHQNRCLGAADCRRSLGLSKHVGLQLQCLHDHCEPFKMHAL